MPSYETTLIAKANTSEDQVNALRQKVLSLIHI